MLAIRLRAALIYVTVLLCVCPVAARAADDPALDYDRDPARIHLEIVDWARKWSLDAERARGKPVVDEVDKTYGLVDDPEQLDRLRKIVERIAAASDRPDMKYDVAILNSPEPNAMAVTGGYVRVTNSLLTMAQSDDELAGVLAHEIGHVCLYHGLRQADRDAKWQKLELIAILGVLAGAMASKNADLLQVFDAVQLSMFARIGILSSYSRQYEHEADWNGLRYTHAAGYDATGFYTFMERLLMYELESGNRRLANDPSTVWDDHPLTALRLNEIRSYFVDQSLPFNRARVCKGFVATVDQAQVAQDLRLWEVKFGGRVIYQLSDQPIDGVGPQERAEAVAKRINDLVDRGGIDIDVLNIRPSTGVITLHGFPVMSVQEQDAKVLGLGQTDYARQVYGAFRAAVYQAVRRSKTP